MNKYEIYEKEKVEKLIVNNTEIKVEEYKFFNCCEEENSLFIQATDDTKYPVRCKACENAFLTIYPIIEKCPVCGRKNLSLDEYLEKYNS